MSNLTLRQLRNTNFVTLYRKLLTSSKLNSKEKTKILELAILFLNNSNQNTKELGYRIILKYSNQFKDYIPLYDVAINKGYIPIAKYIEEKIISDDFPKDKFYNTFLSSFKENFKKEDIYLTKEQYELNSYFEKNNKKNLAIVAPTSYGKSELILSTIYDNRNSNLCILVPTKSLLAQTRQRIINDENYDFNRKIITHPEMYLETDENFIAVLTQERLLRLLQKNNNLSFDIVIIDEAHNLLENDLRNRLLATAIIILNHRNKDIIHKFLTPFLLDFNNLYIDYANYQMKEFRIEENIKSENFYIYNFNKEKKLKLYDQFLNKFFEISDHRYNNALDFIFKHASNKNIIYLNKPKDIEKVSKKFLGNCNLKQNDELLKACKDIGDYVHEDYLLIDCLKKGVAYHHGSVPNNIRLFVEHLFSKIQELSYMITSSTLLEGVNIPGEKLFILDCYKGISYLTHSQFKNLIGRVCRFGEIFNSNSKNLDMLEPDIYIVGEEYISKNANLKNFLRKRVKKDKTYNENPENVLLEETDINNDEKTKDKKDAEEFLENQQPGVTDNENIKHAKTEVGRVCFENNITEIDVIEKEFLLSDKVKKFKVEKGIIKNSKLIMKFIAEIFISNVSEESNNNITRLKEEKAQKFYTMFLNWKIEQASYSEMINSFLRYWEKIITQGKDTRVYVGKWGDLKRGGHRKLWTDIKTKNIKEKINLAIVRIKDEQSFLENKLMKFIEALYDLNLLEKDLFNKIKYGTSDKDMITMVKNGIGLQTAKLLKEEYFEYVNVDIENSTIRIESEILDVMNANEENKVVIFEVSCNVQK